MDEIIFKQLPKPQAKIQVLGTTPVNRFHGTLYLNCINHIGCIDSISLVLDLQLFVLKN